MHVAASGSNIGLLAALPVERALVAAGDNLALARRRRGLSTASMAERAGISKKTLYRLGTDEQGGGQAYPGA